MTRDKNQCTCVLHPTVRMGVLPLPIVRYPAPPCTVKLNFDFDFFRLGDVGEGCWSGIWSRKDVFDGWLQYLAESLPGLAGLVIEWSSIEASTFLAVRNEVPSTEALERRETERDSERQRETCFAVLGVFCSVQ